MDPPVAGTYTYALVSSDAAGSHTSRVVLTVQRPEPVGGGTYRVTTIANVGAQSIRTVQLWSASRANTQSTGTAGATTTCAPAQLDLVLPLAVGRTWHYGGRCRNTSPSGTQAFTMTTDVRVASAGQLTVDGHAEPVWVLRETSRTGSAPEDPNPTVTTVERSLLRAYRVPALVVSTVDGYDTAGKPSRTRTRLELRSFRIAG